MRRKFERKTQNYYLVRNNIGLHFIRDSGRLLSQRCNNNGKLHTSIQQCNILYHYVTKS